MTHYDLQAQGVSNQDMGVSPGCDNDLKVVSPKTPIPPNSKPTKSIPTNRSVKIDRDCLDSKERNQVPGSLPDNDQDDLSVDLDFL